MTRIAVLLALEDSAIALPKYLVLFLTRIAERLYRKVHAECA